MPLSILKEGDKARVVRVTGDDTVRKHLGSLGFVAGVIVRIVSVSHGNMILAVHDSRIAVNDDITRHVMVENI